MNALKVAGFYSQDIIKYESQKDTFIEEWTMGSMKK